MRKNVFPANNTKSVQDTKRSCCISLESKFGFIGGDQETPKGATHSFMPAAPSAIEDLKQDDENLDSLVLADDEIDCIFSEPKINILQDQNEEEIKVEDLDLSAYKQQPKPPKEIRISGGEPVDKTHKKTHKASKIGEQRVRERWARALLHFGVDPKIYANRIDKLADVYPFSEFSFAKAKMGEYAKKKIAQIAVEVVRFEVVNDTYNVECKDITGTTMQGTFHLNCKDKIKKNMKKGCVMVLKNVRS